MQFNTPARTCWATDLSGMLQKRNCWICLPSRQAHLAFIRWSVCNCFCFIVPWATVIWFHAAQDGSIFPCSSREQLISCRCVACYLQFFRLVTALPKYLELFGYYEMHKCLVSKVHFWWVVAVTTNNLTDTLWSWRIFADCFTIQAILFLAVFNALNVSISICRILKEVWQSKKSDQ